MARQAHSLWLAKLRRLRRRQAPAFDAVSQWHKTRPDKKRAAPAAARQPGWIQLTLYFVAGPTRIESTPLMARLEAQLIKLTSGGRELPNNPGLGELIGNRGRSSVDRALRGLAAMGRIRIEITGKLRRIWVAELRQFTRWGPTRKGHAPFSTNKKGAPRPEVVRVERLGAPPVMPIDLGRVRECQWPTGDRGRHLLLCLEPVTTRGKSYCDHHLCLSRPKPADPGQAESDAKTWENAPGAGQSWASARPDRVTQVWRYAERAQVEKPHFDAKA